MDKQQNNEKIKKHDITTQSVPKGTDIQQNLLQNNIEQNQQNNLSTQNDIKEEIISPITNQTTQLLQKKQKSYFLSQKNKQNKFNIDSKSNSENSDKVLQQNQNKNINLNLEQPSHVRLQKLQIQEKEEIQQKENMTKKNYTENLDNQENINLENNNLDQIYKIKNNQILPLGFQNIQTANSQNFEELDSNIKKQSTFQKIKQKLPGLTLKGILGLLIDEINPMFIIFIGFNAFIVSIIFTITMSEEIYKYNNICLNTKQEEHQCQETIKLLQFMQCSNTFYTNQQLSFSTERIEKLFCTENGVTKNQPDLKTSFIEFNQSDQNKDDFQFILERMTRYGIIICQLMFISIILVAIGLFINQGGDYGTGRYILFSLKLEYLKWYRKIVIATTIIFVIIQIYIIVYLQYVVQLSGSNAIATFCLLQVIQFRYMLLRRKLWLDLEQDAFLNIKFNRKGLIEFICSNNFIYFNAIERASIQDIKDYQTNKNDEYIPNQNLKQYIDKGNVQVLQNLLVNQPITAKTDDPDYFKICTYDYKQDYIKQKNKKLMNVQNQQKTPSINNYQNTISGNLSISQNSNSFQVQHHSNSPTFRQRSQNLQKNSGTLNTFNSNLKLLPIQQGSKKKNFFKKKMYQLNHIINIKSILYLITNEFRELIIIFIQTFLSTIELTSLSTLYGDNPGLGCQMNQTTNQCENKLSLKDFNECLNKYIHLFYTHDLYIRKGYCSPGGNLSFEQDNELFVFQINSLFVVAKYCLWVFLLLVISLMVFILTEYFQYKSGKFNSGQFLVFCLNVDQTIKFKKYSRLLLASYIILYGIILSIVIYQANDFSFIWIGLWQTVVVFGEFRQLVWNQKISQNINHPEFQSAEFNRGGLSYFIWIYSDKYFNYLEFAALEDKKHQEINNLNINQINQLSKEQLQQQDNQKKLEKSSTEQEIQNLKIDISVKDQELIKQQKQQLNIYFQQFKIKNNIQQESEQYKQQQEYIELRKKFYPNLSQYVLNGNLDIIQQIILYKY